MAYIVKNDYDGIMYDALNEDGGVVTGIKGILSFFGVPVQTVDKVIKVMNRVKIPIYIVVVLVLLAIGVYLVVFKVTHLLLIAFIFLIEYYFRTNAII